MSYASGMTLFQHRSLVADAKIQCHWCREWIAPGESYSRFTAQKSDDLVWLDAHYWCEWKRNMEVEECRYANLWGLLRGP